MESIRTAYAAIKSRTTPLSLTLYYSSDEEYQPTKADLEEFLKEFNISCEGEDYFDVPKEWIKEIWGENVNFFDSNFMTLREEFIKLWNFTDEYLITENVKAHVDYVNSKETEKWM
jgi:hypothetical protein